jgi:hypothetical protein
MDEKIIADPILDRIIHCVHRIELADVESLRKKKMSLNLSNIKYF